MIIVFKYTNSSMGGWEFLKMNTDNQTFFTGNTASTSDSTSGDLRVTVKTKGELKEIEDRLVAVNEFENLGRK